MALFFIQKGQYIKTGYLKVDPKIWIWSTDHLSDQLSLPWTFAQLDLPKQINCNCGVFIFAESVFAAQFSHLREARLHIIFDSAMNLYCKLFE